jgi:hypothetical protein
MAEINIKYLQSRVGKQQALEQSIALFPAKALAGLLEREHAPAAGDALNLPWRWLYFFETSLRSATLLRNLLNRQCPNRKATEFRF